MNPTTPEEPENGGQDTAPRKRSMGIKPEYKQTPPHYPVAILATAGVAVGAALAIGYCTQRVNSIHTPGLYGTPNWRVLLEDEVKHAFSSEPSDESQGKSRKEATVNPRIESSGKTSGTE